MLFLKEIYRILPEMVSVVVLIQEGNTEPLAKEARDITSNAIELSQDFCEARYHHAKYSALLGDADNAIKQLDIVIKADRKYAVKVANDPGFNTIRDAVISLLDQLKMTAESEARQKIELAEKEITEADNLCPTKFVESDKSAPDIPKEFGKVKDVFEEAHNLYTAGTYFDYLDAVPLANQVAELVSELRPYIIENIKQQINFNLRKAQADLPFISLDNDKIEEAVREAKKLIKTSHDLSREEASDSLHQALNLAEIAMKKAVVAKNLFDETRRMAIEAKEEEARKARERKAEAMRKAEELGAQIRGEIGRMTKICVSIGVIFGFIIGLVFISRFTHIFPSVFVAVITGTLSGLIVGFLISNVIGMFTERRMRSKPLDVFQDQ